MAATASWQLLKMGSPCSDVVPPLPGETPPTIFVPYSRQAAVWNEPALPVIPWHMTLVSRLTSMLMVRNLPSP